MRSVAFAPDGGWVVSAGGDKRKGQLRFWDRETGELWHDCEHKIGVYSLAASPDGSFVAAGEAASNEGALLVLWDVETGQRR